MASFEDMLLRKMLLKFSTSGQVSECVEIQEKSSETRALGEIMLEKGYITQTQLNLLLNMQNQKSNGTPKSDGEIREESLFGKIVLMKKLAREGQIKECLKLQMALKEREGKYLKLGEILIQKAYLTRYQVEEILRIQQDHKKDFVCEVCGTTFLSEDLGQSIRYRCPKCEIVLTFPK